MYAFLLFCHKMCPTPVHASLQSYLAAGGKVCLGLNFGLRYAAIALAGVLGEVRCAWFAQGSTTTLSYRFRSAQVHEPAEGLLNSGLCVPYQVTLESKTDTYSLERNMGKAGKLHKHMILPV